MSSPTPTAPKPPPPGHREEPRPPRLPAQGSLRWSFTWAFEGIVYVLRTQRNMQFHVAAAVGVLVLALVLDVSRLEMLAIVGAIALVMIAEMVNTAVEATVDLVATEYHPLAKVAKDVAAGAVLVATANALAVAYLVFYGALTGPTHDLLHGVRRSPVHIVVIALILTTLLSIAVKASLGRGTPLRGGLPSGHAAAAFAGWMAITLVTEPLNHAALVSTLAFMMALLVAQSRVEAGIHSGVEVFAGAILGTGVTLLVFQALP